MLAPGDGEILSLWEHGSLHHPIDRALLLGSWARPDLDPSRLASLPLGALNASLLRLRSEWWGSGLQVFADCPVCRQRLTVELEVGDLLGGAPDGDLRPELEAWGFRFRVPDSRDLAAIVGMDDPDHAALVLLGRCRVGRPDVSEHDMAGFLSKVEDALEEVDPAASFELRMECQACGDAWSIDLVPGELIWDELDVMARRILDEVHCLAHAYGWTEGEVLQLSRVRRAAYLELTNS